MSERRTVSALWLVAALWAASTTGVRAQTGAVTGTVYDSINAAPLADAAVFLWETTYRAVSDADGRFRIDGVPPGRYSVLFFHTQLGEMGISPGPHPVVVGADEATEVALATPSMPTVITSHCLTEASPEGSGVVVGRVRDGYSDVALGGSAVSITWDVAGSRGPGRRDLRAVGGGWYFTCSAPADTPLLAAASFYGRESRRLEIRVADDGVAQVDFQLYALTPSAVAGRLVDARSHAAVAGAEVWLRGTQRRVLTDGRGLFDLGEVVPGTYMLMADHLAYGPKMDTLEVPASQRLSVEMRLDTRPIEIAPLTVTVAANVPVNARVTGGIVVTREEIDGVRQRSRDASDIIRSLHIPGVLVRHQSNGVICVGYSSGQVKMNQTGCVEMMIFINDVRATDADLALRLPPDAIERMVIYKPVEAGNLFGLGGGNGVWMIYTRGN